MHILTSNSLLINQELLKRRMTKFPGVNTYNTNSIRNLLSDRKGLQHLCSLCCCYILEIFFFVCALLFFKNQQNNIIEISY